MSQLINPTRLSVPVTPRDHSLGEAEAPVTLVLYCDFECPDCKIFYPELKALLEETEGITRLVYRHLPLTDVHPNALNAAKAAEAAGKQGKFAEMYTALFESGNGLKREGLFRTAEEIGVNLEPFEKDYEETAYEAVFEDVEGIRKLGIGSTPTLFVNGARYEGRFTREALGEMISEL